MKGSIRRNANGMPPDGFAPAIKGEINALKEHIRR
jgi:hypothetical protein